MTESVSFEEATARRLERIYVTPDAARRRRAAQDALALAAGERVIDIGCGPGFFPLEIAELVGPDGEVLGIDISEVMLQLARRRCSELPNVRFENADALKLPAGDASFEVGVAIQVYEYVQDVDRALRELNRVLRVGGRAAIVSTDWPSIAWDSSSDELMERVLISFAQHCPHQTLPRTLAARLRSAGFSIESQLVLPQFNPNYGPDAFSVHLIDVVASFVSMAGMPEEDAAAWAADLHSRGRSGEYFFCVNQYLFVASKV